MANKTIKNKFKNLYNEFKQNLSNESRGILEEIYTWESKSIYNIKHRISNALLNEAAIITIESEKEFPIEKLIECNYYNVADWYSKALIMLEEDIDKTVKTQDFIINKNVDYDDENYVFLNLLDKYKKAINTVKKQFSITGEVIDFLLKVCV